MKKMWNKTFVEMFGKMAYYVTVGQLLRMRSGIGDFDVPAFDHSLLVDKPFDVHSPLENLEFVSKFTEHEGCRHYNCTFACEPGTCGFYSSTNFILAGLVLLNHAPKGQ